jgi:hypothetical protein
MAKPTSSRCAAPGCARSISPSSPLAASLRWPLRPLLLLSFACVGGCDWCASRNYLAASARAHHAHSDAPEYWAASIGRPASRQFGHYSTPAGPWRSPRVRQPPVAATSSSVKAELLPPRGLFSSAFQPPSRNALIQVAPSAGASPDGVQCGAARSNLRHSPTSLRRTISKRSRRLPAISR